MGRMVNRTGLSERLHQHSRRSGMLVGVSMAIVAAVLIASFTWLFFRLDPFFSDFAGSSGAARSSPVAARVVATARSGSPVAGTTPAVGNPFPQLPTPTALAAATARSSATPGFVATHRIADFGQQVNLRAGAGVTSASVALLAPGTRLQYLNLEERVGDTVWRRFQTERGDTGWMRQLDTIPTPGGTPVATPR